MKYEITSQLSDDIIMNNAIMENMEDISNLQNTIKLQQKLIESLNIRVDTFMLQQGLINTLSERVDILMKLITTGSVTVESRV